MTRIRNGAPIEKNPRGMKRDHSPSERRHHHPTGESGMDAARAEERYQDKR